jgi:hypothetical protein
MARVFARADVTFRLNLAWGGQASAERGRRWFFEVPAARDTPEAWAELLHRIFYDSNVQQLRTVDPAEAKWLGLERFSTAPVDPLKVLAWDGAPATRAEAFPWSDPCYFVDDAGRYDVMTAHDYTELVLLRLHAAGTVDRAGYVRFFERYFPNAEKGAGDELWNDREQRLANLVLIRSQPHLYRRAPGSQPVASGPVDPALVSR